MNTRERGGEKLLGRDLLVATVTRPGATRAAMSICRPANWVDF